MKSATKWTIWIIAVLASNAAVWVALQGLSPLTVLAASIAASLMVRELVGTLFYFTNQSDA